MQRLREGSEDLHRGKEEEDPSQGKGAGSSRSPPLDCQSTQEVEDTDGPGQDLALWNVTEGRYLLPGVGVEVAPGQGANA